MIELSLRQKKLLKLLSINCRFTNKDIAKSIHCSEDAVEYQINKLIKQEKLAKFFVQFDYYLLGYRQYHIWISLNKLNNNYQELSKIEEIISINESYGKFDLQIVILVKNKIELEKTIKKIKSTVDAKEVAMAEYYDSVRPFTNIIPSIDVDTNIPNNKKNKTYSLNSGEFIHIPQEKNYKLDKIDKKVIPLLIKDPRIKFSELSEQSGINHETLRYRLHKYIEDKLILNFGLLHDFQKYGLFTTYLLVNLKEINKELKSYLINNPNIFYAGHLIGAYNGIIYIVSKDPLDLGMRLKELRNVLKDNLLNMDLIHMEKIYKYIQFPMQELE